MITVLHGDNIDASRTELLRLIAGAKGKDVRELNGRSLDANQLTQAVESSALFGNDAFVVIENLFGKLGRQVKRIESLTTIIKQSSNDVVVWEEKELGATVIKNLDKATVKLFKTPPVIFQLLDGLRPGAARTLVSFFRQIMAVQPAEITYTLLVRRVRQLIQLSDHVMPEALAPWQTTRLTAQARLFTMNQLIGMHTKLLDMDIAIKTGASPFTLAQLIEQFLISL